MRYHTGVSTEHKWTILNDLAEVSELLGKYHLHGQRRIVDEIIESWAVDPDLKRLAGIDMWGGAGAVWEVLLTSASRRTPESIADEQAFKNAIIRVSEAMDGLGVGTEKSRFVANAFRSWRDLGPYT